MKREYKTVQVHTLKGLRQAERLKANGWKIAYSGLFSINFYRDTKPRKAA